MAQLEPWGEFNPGSVKKLLSVGVKLRFFTLPQKSFDELDKGKFPVEVVKQIGSKVYFVIIERGEPVTIDAEEVRLPDFSLKELSEKIKAQEEAWAKLDKTASEMTAYIDLIESFKIEKYNQLRYEQARLAMQGQASGKLLKFSGWFPAAREGRIKDFLKDFGAYFSTREPLPEDNVPVQLKNQNIPKLFEPITGMYGLPQYSEIDVTPFMTPFFRVFLWIVSWRPGIWFDCICRGFYSTIQSK